MWSPYLYGIQVHYALHTVDSSYCDNDICGITEKNQYIELMDPIEMMVNVDGRDGEKVLQ